jgi:hypothetical protein
LANIYQTASQIKKIKHNLNIEIDFDIFIGNLTTGIFSNKNENAEKANRQTNQTIKYKSRSISPVIAVRSRLSVITGLTMNNKTP